MYHQLTHAYLHHMDATGYGADISIDSESVTISHSERAQKFGKMPAGVRVPLGDVRDVELKGANALANGHLTVVTDDAEGKQTRVVHFRRKDNDAFAAVRDAIVGALR